MGKILVTGGAGYIGSHTVRIFLDMGLEVVVYDSLVNGHRESLPDNVKLVVASLEDVRTLDKVFRENDFDAVVHFAGLIEVGESMRDPVKFYGNNVHGAFNLLSVMRRNGVRKILFSSSAAIFGSPNKIPISEDEKKVPNSVYGETKLIFEKMLSDFDRAYGMNFISLRYFNAAGAGFGIGEDHNPESHLIPLILQVALGKREHVKVFGTDYETADGTCVRDYVHVLDLAEAHKVALIKLLGGDESSFYNLGNGRGYSVKEVIEVAREVTGCDIPVVECERREGDSAVLVADSMRIREDLGWVPKRDLKNIVESAWEWHRNNPDGF